MKKLFVFFITISCIACSTVHFNYQSTKNINPPIDVLTKIEIKSLDTELKKYFPDFEKEFTEALLKDFKQRIFPSISNHSPLIRANIYVNQLKFERNYLGCYWFPFVILGAPAVKNISKADITLEVFSEVKKFKKTYHSRIDSVKWNGLYYSIRYSIAKDEKFLAKLVFQKAIDDIKEQLEKDRDLILLAFQNNQQQTVSKTDNNPPQILLIQPSLDQNNKALVSSPELIITGVVADEYGIKEVSVNKQIIKLKSDGSFTYSITLNNDVNIISIRAIDKNNNISEKYFIVQYKNNQTNTNNVVLQSDVDIEIPSHEIKSNYRFALIIGNEDYSSFQSDLNSEANVIYAENDARIFKEYCEKTLGIPQENIVFKINANAIDLNRAIEKMCIVTKSLNGKAEIFIYYAGHGFPDSQTKEPYLIPVDVSAKDLKFAVKLSDMYKKLAEFPSKRIVVFLDACFTGGGRNLGLLSSRGIKITPIEHVLSGNILVYSASSFDQPSLPYKEKQHGMFTYFLLKKIKETKANISYGDLFNFISEQVGVKSALVNEKEQIPKIQFSQEINEIWKNWKVNE